MVEEESKSEESNSEEIEVAEEPFEMWLGRHVHMSGIITWQVLETPDGPVIAPATAPGILRIN